MRTIFFIFDQYISKGSNELEATLVIYSAKFDSSWTYEEIKVYMDELDGEVCSVDPLLCLCLITGSF